MGIPSRSAFPVSPKHEQGIHPSPAVQAGSRRKWANFLPWQAGARGPHGAVAQGALTEPREQQFHKESHFSLTLWSFSPALSDP